MTIMLVPERQIIGQKSRLHIRKSQDKSKSMVNVQIYLDGRTQDIMKMTNHTETQTFTMVGEDLLWILMLHNSTLARFMAQSI